MIGIHNKRSLLEFLDRELARSCRHRRPLALVMIDIDHFKAINDGLGLRYDDGSILVELFLSWLFGHAFTFLVWPFDLKKILLILFW